MRDITLVPKGGTFKQKQKSILNKHDVSGVKTVALNAE